MVVSRFVLNRLFNLFGRKAMIISSLPAAAGNLITLAYVGVEGDVLVMIGLGLGLGILNR